MTKYFLIASALMISFSAQAMVDQCAKDLKDRIDYAYNEGGLTVKNTVGPIHYNEGTPKGGLAYKVAYAVAYKNDPEVNPGPAEGNVVITAECSHSEPSRAIDKNKDGVFNLEDAVTVGN